MPKTGTTALQDRLDKEHTQLRAAGVVYPRTGRFCETDICHHKFFLSFALNSPAWPFSPFPIPDATYASMVEALYQELGDTRQYSVLLSSEMLFELGRDKNTLTLLRDSFTYSQVEVLLVLRKRSDFIESMYAQRVRGPQRYTGSPKKHLREFYEAGILDYETIVGNFLDVFGYGNVHLYWYEHIKADISHPISEVLGYELTNEITARRVNVRPTWLTIFGLRVLNIVARQSGRKRQFFLRRLKTVERIFSFYDMGFILNDVFKPYKASLLRELDALHAASDLRLNRLLSIPRSGRTKLRHDDSKNE